MSATITPLAQNPTDVRPPPDPAYAAMCVWEDMLAIKTSTDPERKAFLTLWERLGTEAMRTRALAIAEIAEAVWNALDDDARDMLAPFDWEFVPTLVRSINFEAPYPSLPTVESAMATMQAKALAPQSRGFARRETADEPTTTAPPWVTPKTRLFLVAYEGADDRPYALALSDQGVAARLARKLDGEVIDTLVDNHADMAADVDENENQGGFR